MNSVAIKVTKKEAKECISILNRCGCSSVFTGCIEGNEAYYIIYYNNYKYVKLECTPKAPSMPIRKYSNIEFFKLPKEIQADMVSRTKQLNCIGFIISLRAVACNGGFNWDSTPEGEDYWTEILTCKHYSLYYKTNNKKENENQFQKQDSALNGRGGKVAAGVRCKGNKFRITVKHLSHRKVIGRG